MTELRKRGLTLAVAESCTGGLLGGAVTSVPGSSAVFRGGIVAYSDDIKRQLLEVPAAVLSPDGPGAVSVACVAAMAAGVRRALRARVGVAVSGIAGPGGATEGKPVGTVWIAVDTAQHRAAQHWLLRGDREAVRKQAVDAALRLALATLD